MKRTQAVLTTLSIALTVLLAACSGAQNTRPGAPAGGTGQQAGGEPIKIGASIPTSSQVANATNSGEPITSAIPKHPVSVAVTNLGRTVTAATAPTQEGASAPPPARVQKRGLLRRNSR